MAIIADASVTEDKMRILMSRRRALQLGIAGSVDAHHMEIGAAASPRS